MLGHLTKKEPHEWLTNPASSSWLLARGGQLSSLSTEALGAARRIAEVLGGAVTAVAFGSGASDYGRQAIAYGADDAIAVEDTGLDEYRNETWTAAMTAVATEVNPAVVLIGQTATGRDLAPRFAIRIGTAVAMDCVDFEVSNGALRDDATLLRRRRDGEVHEQDAACGRHGAPEGAGAARGGHLAHGRGAHDDLRHRGGRLADRQPASRCSRRACASKTRRSSSPVAAVSAAPRPSRSWRRWRRRWAAPSAPAAPSSTSAGCR